MKLAITLAILATAATSVVANTPSCANAPMVESTFTGPAGEAFGDLTVIGTLQQRVVLHDVVTPRARGEAAHSTHDNSFFLAEVEQIEEEDGQLINTQVFTACTK